MWVAPIEYRTRGSDDYFSILDHASTTYQLKLKEAIHIQWELTTHLAILFANRGEFDRRRKSPIYDMQRNRRYLMPIAAVRENRNRSTGHTWRFSPIALIGLRNR